MKRDDIEKHVAALLGDDEATSKQSAAVLLTQFLDNVQAIADAMKTRGVHTLTPRADESKS